MVVSETSWRVEETALLAVLDERLHRRLADWPRLLMALHERSVLRSHSLLVRLAIAEHPQIARRVHLVLWHLADRWGTVEEHGVFLPLKLSRVTLADLVCSTRESVSRSLGVLERRGLVRGRGSGYFLRFPSPAQSHRRPDDRDRRHASERLTVTASRSGRKALNRQIARLRSPRSVGAGPAPIRGRRINQDREATHASGQASACDRVRGGGRVRRHGDADGCTGEGPGGAEPVQLHRVPPERQLVGVRGLTGRRYWACDYDVDGHRVRAHIDTSFGPEEVDRTSAWAPSQGCAQPEGVAYGGGHIIEDQGLHRRRGLQRLEAGDLNPRARVARATRARSLRENGDRRPPRFI